MPKDSLILSIAVCGVFPTFAAVPAWIDHSTSRWQRSRASKKQIGPSRKKAA
jgi:hypothetical protein